MKKQIEDLARKCGAWNQVYGDRMFMIDKNFNIEKFAELIVWECAEHALTFNNNIQSLNDKVMRGNLDRVQDYIKDRMGVEE
jgi:hypothetical protein